MQTREVVVGVEVHDEQQEMGVKGRERGPGVKGWRKSGRGREEEVVEQGPDEVKEVKDMKEDVAAGGGSSPPPRHPSERLSDLKLTDRREPGGAEHREGWRALHPRGLPLGRQGKGG